MAKDKKPSIFADRGTIGSSDELDEYGVWVKSEPQDLSQAFPEADGFSTEMPESDDIDAVIPNFEDLPDFDALGSISPYNDISANIPDISEDSFDLPDLESDSKITEEDDDSDVFNFGDLTEPVELNSINQDSENPYSGELDSAVLSDKPEEIEPNALGSSQEPDSTDDDGFNEISMDEFIGTQDLPDTADPFKSGEPIEINSDITTAPAIVAKPENIVSKASGFQPVQSEEKATVKESQSMDLSTQLLMKIAEELSSIRSELSTLKKEFSGLRTVAMPKAEGKEKDFIEEEDDEKISLTGDELNNILNTADFTEEAGSDAASAISDDEDDSDNLNLSTADLDMEIDLSDSNLENLEGETKLGNSSLIDIAASSDSLESADSKESDDSAISGEDIQIHSDTEIPAEMPMSADIAMSDDSIIDFSSEATDELNEIRENGVEPMVVAPPPEDTNYLAEDPLAGNIDSEELPAELSEESTDEGIDLSGAVIDEPDLSSEIHDNPLEEPSLEDISISLDLSDLNSIDLDSGGADSIEAESAEGDTELPITEDAIQVEDNLSPIPEGLAIEEDDFGGILENGVSFNEITEEVPDEISETIVQMPEETIKEFPSVIEEFSSVSDDSAAVVPNETITEAQPLKQETSGIPENLKTELKTVLSYMDQLLEALPDDKIEEFAKSDYYDTYKKLFKELGLA
jgi:pilus assembly protein FimV